MEGKKRPCVSEEARPVWRGREGESFTATQRGKEREQRERESMNDRDRSQWRKRERGRERARKMGGVIQLVRNPLKEGDRVSKRRRG